MIVLPALGVAMVDDGLGTAVGQLRDQCAQGCGNDGEGDAEDGVLACVGGAVGKGRLAANALLPRHLEHLAERQSTSVGMANLKILSPKESGSFSL